MKSELSCGTLAFRVGRVVAIAVHATQIHGKQVANEEIDRLLRQPFELTNAVYLPSITRERRMLSRMKQILPIRDLPIGTLDDAQVKEARSGFDMDYERLTLTTEIIKLRKQTKLSQAELAEATGYSLPMVKSLAPIVALPFGEH